MQTLSPSLRIGVLRGGPADEYEDSLKSGANVLKYLSQTHRPIDIFVTKDNKWHMNGMEKSPERILRHIDVIWNGLYGRFDNSEQIREILNHAGTPCTGSDRLESAMAMNKWIAKEQAILSGIKTPVSVLVRRTDSLFEKAKEIFNSIPHPLLVKSATNGSSGVSYKVQSFSELLTALEDVLIISNSALVEEYIPGKLASCGIIDDFRGQKTYTLPPAQIVSADVINCPGLFSEKEKKEIERVAQLIHNKLGLRHYSNSDFVVSPKRGVYLLEVNTIPKLHEKSFLPKSLEAVGIEIKEFLYHLLNLAINRKI